MTQREPDPADPARQDDATSYAAWTQDDVRRGADEARVLGEIPDPAARRATDRPAPDVEADLRDVDGDGTIDEIVVDTTAVSGVDSAGRPFGAHDPGGPRSSGGGAGTGAGPDQPGAFPAGVYVGRFPPAGAPGAGPYGPGQQGPGLSGLFGAGTPLGEATGLRLAPRKRWVAFLYGLVLGFLGAQSFYTGRVFRGVFQAAPVISAWVLTLLTLGLLEPLALGVTAVVWIWGAFEGVAYLVARTGTYSTDVLGGRLT